METVLGFDIIILSLIIAVSGTVLHQARSYNGKPLPRILDGAMTTVGVSFVAAHTALLELAPTEPFQQTLLILSLIGFTVPGAALGQKMFSKVRQKIKTQKKDGNQIFYDTKKLDSDTGTDGDKYINIENGDLFEKKNGSWEKIAKITDAKPTKKTLIPPELSPKDSWYQNNFKKSDKGNVLQYGQVYLWLRVKDVRSYVTAILKDANGIALQVDQSHEYDEDKNIETTRLELLKDDGTPFPRGIYHLTVQGDRGTGDSQGIVNDTFEII